MGDTPTSPGIRKRRIALATLSWLSPIRCPCLWETLIGALLCPYGAGIPKSEHLPDGASGLGFYSPARKSPKRPQGTILLGVSPFDRKT